MSTGFSKSYRPLSISVGMRTRGAKFSRSISGGQIVPQAARLEDADLQPRLNRRENHARVAANADAVVREPAGVDVTPVSR